MTTSGVTHDASHATPMGTVLHCGPALIGSDMLLEAVVGRPLPTVDKVLPADGLSARPFTTETVSASSSAAPMYGLQLGADANTTSSLPIGRTEASVTPNRQPLADTTILNNNVIPSSPCLSDLEHTSMDAAVAPGVITYRAPDARLVEMDPLVGTDELLSLSTELVLDAAASLLGHHAQAAVISELRLIESTEVLASFDTPSSVQAPGHGTNAFQPHSTGTIHSLPSIFQHPEEQHTLLDGTIYSNSLEPHGEPNIRIEHLRITALLDPTLGLLTDLSPLLDMGHLTQFPFPMISATPSPSIVSHENLPFSAISSPELENSIISLIPAGSETVDIEIDLAQHIQGIGMIRYLVTRVFRTVAFLACGRG